MPKSESPKRRKAVALHYDADSEQAPKVIAKGSGHVADRILELAAEHGVEIFEDRDLVEALAQLDVNQEIPETLFKAVAEVLAFVYRLNRGLGDTA